MILESKVNVKFISNISEVSNANFHFCAEGIHTWHTNCPWSVDYKKVSNYCYAISVKGQGQIGLNSVLIEREFLSF